MGRASRRAPIGFFVFALAASSITALGFGCSLQDGGTISALGHDSPDAAKVDATDSGSDASSPPNDGGDITPDGDSGKPDTGAPPFDAGCGQTFAASTMTAFSSSHAKTIDGMDDDWGCEAPFAFDAADSAIKQTKDGGYEVSGLCKFEWSPTELYLYCDVTDPSAGGGTNGNPTMNDAVGFYVSGTTAASRTGNYGNFDHQYAVDWRNTKAEFANAKQLGGSPNAFTTAVHTHAGGYAVEASIDTNALLSGSSLGSGMTLGFDVEIDDGINQVESFVWYQAATHVACGACTSTGGADCCCVVPTNSADQPYCDALELGSITLHP